MQVYFRPHQLPLFFTIQFMHVSAVLAHRIIIRTMSWYMHRLDHKEYYVMSLILYIIEHENNNLVHSFYFVV